MKVYESFGTFDDVKKEFNLAVQLTDIVPDKFEIKKWYDISDDKRYAIVAILETAAGNDSDLSAYPADFAYIISDNLFTNIDQSYRTGITDRDINDVKNGDVIDVIVHHAIGFDPKRNTDDDQSIKDYKSATFSRMPGGSKPGVGGRGILK